MSSHLLYNMQHVRKMLGLTAGDCAKRLGITQSTYSRHEQGRRRMYFDKVWHLAGFMGVPVDYFTRDLTVEESTPLLIRGEERRKLRASDIAPGEAELLTGWTGDLPGEPVVVAGRQADIAVNPAAAGDPELQRLAEDWEGQDQ